MRQYHDHGKAVQVTILALFAMPWCMGCTLGDALIDGLFLGISEIVGTLISAPFVG